MTTTEIRIKGLRLIESVITLKCNVNNGCVADKSELEKESSRLDGFKKWAIENNQLNEVKLYLTQKNWGMHRQFAASEISTFFHN